MASMVLACLTYYRPWRWRWYVPPTCRVSTNYMALNNPGDHILHSHRRENVRTNVCVFACVCACAHPQSLFSCRPRFQLVQGSPDWRVISNEEEMHTKCWFVNLRDCWLLNEKKMRKWHLRRVVWNKLMGMRRGWNWIIDVSSGRVWHQQRWIFRFNY
jgi:hypothetical protein